MLINGSTDTTYWQNYVFEHATVCFLNRRVRFLKAGSDKPVANLCPSAIVYFGINGDEFVSTWKDHGAIVTRSTRSTPACRPWTRVSPSHSVSPPRSASAAPRSALAGSGLVLQLSVLARPFSRPLLARAAGLNERAAIVLLVST